MTAPMLTARDIHGKSWRFEKILSLQTEATLDSPADGLTIAFLPETESVPELTEMTLWQGGEQLFTGMVDEQEITWSKKGLKIELAGRSWGALLLDNEALPATHESLTLSELASRSLTPYGKFGLALPGRTKLARYVVPKGISEWEALCRFCRLATGALPWLDGQLILRQGPRSLGKRWYSSQLPIEEVRWQLRRDKVVSRVCLRDSYGYYSTAVDLTYADQWSIHRKRYLIPPSLYAGRQGQDADDLLTEAFGEKHRVEITLAGLHPLRPGDQLDPPAGFAPWPVGVICRVEQKLGDTGSRTTVELADPIVLPWLMG